jgi:hypothetical protein
MKYSAELGETLVIYLTATDGEVDGTELLRAGLKKAAANGGIPAITVPEDAEFAVTFTAAAGSAAAFWTLTLTASETAALSQGLYYGDARMEFGSSIFYTDPFQITFSYPVTQAS